MEMGTGRADPDFEEILGKAAVGGELSVEEGGRLLEAEGYELLRLVAVADELRRKTVGDVVTYVVNRNLNFSNVCLSDCKFCAFKRPPGAPGAYMLTREQIATRVREAVTSGATEVCVQGGLHPEFGLENYLEILRTIREVSPDIHIHAFSPAELDHISKIEHMGVGEVIKALREAGLDSVPGTAAEILVDRVRSIICPKKISSARWVEVIEVCHRLGVPTTATMLYGTIETPYERAEHLVLLREVQHRTGGFTEFVPLAFMPYNTPLWGDGERSPPSLADSLRVHAVARLMLAGNIDNIQASWVKLGPRGAQLMLRAGANDLGGTLMEENITRAAGGKNHSMTVQRLKQLISELGRVPKQRMTTYELL
jgi:FO synthase subunit 2